jgi:hypothetical protein
VPHETPLLGLVLAAGGLLTVLLLAMKQISAARLRREHDEALEVRKAADRDAKRAAEETDEDR